MSLSATRSIRSKSAIVDRAIDNDAVLEIREYLEGCYEAPASLSEAQLKRRAFRRWMLNRFDVMQQIGVAEVRRTEWGTEEDFVFTKSLESIGVDTPRLGNRFVDFYLQVYKPTRSWVSGCQVDQGRVAHIACTPNYNRLPDWVRQGMMRAPHSAKIGGDRIGNIWRLIPCVKAWKWANLPKHIAEKLGKASPRLRMLSAWAFANAETWNYAESRKYTRTETEASFWGLLNDLDKATLGDIVDWMFRDDVQSPAWQAFEWDAFLTESLGLPWGLIQTPKHVSKDVLIETIATYANPAQACQVLFGVAGKATVAAFKSSDKNRWQWAQAIGDSNPDAVQKILTLEECIAFQPEVVDFLKSLPMVSRIRLLQATTFRYRGTENPITDDHVRDTGYLWKNIKETPELGRVRCWFSLHEELAAAFVKELPDEVLPIPQGWEKVDGLCAIDKSWEIEIPKRVATLKYYGQALRNCVGGYGPAIKQGRSVIFVIREHGQLTHCVEVSNEAVRQFYRSGNSYADASIKESVCTALRQAKLID